MERKGGMMGAGHQIKSKPSGHFISHLGDEC